MSISRFLCYAGILFCFAMFVSTPIALKYLDAHTKDVEWMQNKSGDNFVTLWLGVCTVLFCPPATLYLFYLSDMIEGQEKGNK